MMCGGEPMNENTTSHPDRFEQLLSEMAELRERLYQVELRLGLAPRMPARPPAPRESLPSVPRRPAFDLSAPPAAPPTAPARTVSDAEDRFGSVVLPRVGAGVVLLGIAYLVGLSVARGWLTPWHQFYGALALCAAFIGVGLWQRASRFEFGQVLVGIGSCGMYVAFAAGYGLQSLYSGETLVTQCVALSLANLAYGALTPSRTFVGIGLLGGLAASLFPLERGDFALSIMLHGLIALPSAAILAKNRWPALAVCGWVVSTLALLPPCYEAPNGPFEYAPLYASTLAFVLAYVFSNRNWDFDPQHAFVPLAAFLAGLLAFALELPLAHWHETAFGAALLLASLLPVELAAKRGLRLAGVLTPFLFAPMGLDATAPMWAYLALAAGSLAVAWLGRRWGFGLAALGMGLSLAFYGSKLSMGLLPQAQEAGYLATLLAVVIAGCAAAARLGPLAERAALVGAFLATPLVSRLAVLLTGTPESGASWPLATVSTLLALGAGGAAASIVLGWRSMSVFAWCVLAAAGGFYLLGLGEHPFAFAEELVLLTAMLAVLALSALAAERASGEEAVMTVATYLGWAVFSRLAVVVFAKPTFALGTAEAVTLSWTLYAAGALVAGFWSDRRSIRLAALSLFCLTLAKVLLVDLSGLDPAARVALLLLLGVAMLAGGYWYVRRLERGGHANGVPGAPA
jgi:uncharacterized membrane protein